MLVQSSRMIVARHVRQYLSDLWHRIVEAVLTNARVLAVPD